MICQLLRGHWPPPGPPHLPQFRHWCLDAATQDGHKDIFFICLRFFSSDIASEERGCTADDSNFFLKNNGVKFLLQLHFISFFIYQWFSSFKCATLYYLINEQERINKDGGRKIFIEGMKKNLQEGQNISINQAARLLNKWEYLDTLGTYRWKKKSISLDIFPPLEAPADIG